MNSHALPTVPVYKKYRIALLLCIFETNLPECGLLMSSAGVKRSHLGLSVCASVGHPPKVKVYIDTPYFEGETIALCMENPLVGVIWGNIPGAGDAHGPDIN